MEIFIKNSMYQITGPYVLTSPKSSKTHEQATTVRASLLRSLAERPIVIGNRHAF